MKKLAFLFLTVLLPLQAAANQFNDDITIPLTTTIINKVGCPVAVNLINGSYELSFSPECTQDKIAAANAYMASFDPTMYRSQITSKSTYIKAMASGVALSSSSTPALNATYAIDQASQFNITAEMVSINTNGTFTNGQSSRPWPDSIGTYHVFTVAQFKSFSTAIAQYVDDLAITEQALISGQQASWPTASISIP